MKYSVLESAQYFVRVALTANLRLKILALLITLLIFGLVRGGREATTRLVVDVEALTPPLSSTRVLVTEAPDVVKLRVRGSPRMVQMVADEEIPPLTLDLRESSDGQYVLDESMFILPPGLEIVAITPPAFDLRYELRISRYLAVRPNLSGNVAEGHHIREPIKVSPPGVIVSGARSVLDEQIDIESEPIPVHGLGQGKHRRIVALEALPPHCNYEAADRVTVQIEVEPDFIEREIKGIRVEVRGATLPAKAEPVTMLLRGPPDAVNAIQAEEIVAYVDIGEDGAAAGTYRKDVSVSSLDPSIAVRLVPPAVIVEVSAAPEDDAEAAPRPPASEPTAPPHQAPGKASPRKGR